MPLHKTIHVPIITFLFIVYMVSCNNGSKDPDPDNPTVKVPDSITVNLNVTFQEIRGFGGCNSVFRGAVNYPNESDIRKAYGTGDNHIGLTMFRVSIPPDPSGWSAIADVALMAQEQGAIVFASPWDAPPEMLDPGEEEHVILPSMYGEYVKHLNAFNSFMTASGVNLYAISIQNEPDIGEWTQWSPGAVRTFTKEYAGDINNRVITAESFNFNREYYNPILADPDATANIDIVGGHIYGNGLGEIPAAEQQGKEIWMTEYLLNDFNNGNREFIWSEASEAIKWDQSLEMLNSIHESMVSNWNAYIWWYLKRYYSFIGDGQEGTSSGEVLKRGYAISHFSRFVRPGYTRVDVKHDKLADLKVTAYEGGGKVVIQVLNTTGNNIPEFKIVVPDFNVATANAYITSEGKNRAPEEIEVIGGKAYVKSFAESITTVILEN
jgi:glucuronoarabinoxylan endo-1,4-beta-xylanase